MLLIGLPLGSTAANTKKKIAKVTEAVTISDNWDYTVTGDEPFADGGSIDIVNTEHAVVILEKVKPSAAIKLLAKYVTINGAKAVNNNNCQVKIYNCGAIILPYPDKQMLTVYSEPDFGGTSVTCWQSITKLESTEEGRKFIADYKADSSVYASYDEYLKAEKDYEDKAGIYEGKVAEVLKKDRFLTYYDTELITGGGPWPPPKGPESVRRPGALFEGMVRRIVPMAVRGVIFYQGEEDTERYSREYGVLFKSMIDEWRDIFREEKLPFIYCQLPEFEPEDDVNWPELRRQQKRISEEVPCAYMADLIGCGEVGNVHPSQKKIPGERLAKLAVRFVYGL